MESIITKYTDSCVVCGSLNAEIHHCVFGTAGRQKSENLGLTIPLCRKCHEELHTKSKVASTFSKIIGQLAFEKAECEKGVSSADAREHFRKAFGKSYL